MREAKTEVRNGKRKNKKTKKTTKKKKKKGENDYTFRHRDVLQWIDEVWFEC